MVVAARAEVVAPQEHMHADVERVVRWSHFALPGVVLLALLVRMSLIVLAPGMLDGDEALVGIQAERIAAGTAHPLPVFFYGQHYMGAIESYLAAGLLHLFSPSVPTLRVIPLLFAVAFVALTYHLTRRVAGRRAAAFAGLVAAFPPLYLSVISIKAWGGYVESLTLGSAPFADYTSQPEGICRGLWPVRHHRRRSGGPRGVARRVQSLGWTRHRLAAVALTLVSPCVFLAVWNGQQSTVLLATLGLALYALRRGYPLRA